METQCLQMANYNYTEHYTIKIQSSYNCEINTFYNSEFMQSGELLTYGSLLVSLVKSTQN
jgi:hypothetical protein